jgi:hypothetical protein
MRSFEYVQFDALRRAVVNEWHLQLAQVYVVKLELKVIWLEQIRNLNKNIWYNLKVADFLGDLSLSLFFYFAFCRLSFLLIFIFYFFICLKFVADEMTLKKW